MIGSGIFASASGVFSQAGSVGLTLSVWTGCGISAMLGALCYCELGTMILKSGGEFVYLLEGLGHVAVGVVVVVVVVVGEEVVVAVPEVVTVSDGRL